MAGKIRSVNILIDEPRFQNLVALASFKGISRSAVIRQLIDNDFKHSLSQRPTCANGHACFVPQMQHYQPPVQVTNSPPEGQHQGG